MIQRLKKSEENVLYVRSIFVHPEIAPFVSSDGFDLENFPFEEALESPKHYFLCASVGDERAGLFFAHEWNSATAWCHVMLLPRFRGRTGLRLGKEAIKWWFENTEYKKLVGTVPATNRQALWYDYKLGFVEEGRIRRCFPRGGELHDEIIVGLCKGGE